MDAREMTARAPRTVAFALLAVLGLSFWFWLAFPWGHHNESYSWAVQLERIGPLEAATQQLYPVATLRPLGTLTAWLTYHLAGGSIALQQLINFAVAAIAWLVVYHGAAQKRVFAVVALAAGGLFFSGYIYLFHLHGVFYSPALLYLAILLAQPRAGLEPRRLMVLGALALVVALYHPFALLFYVAYVGGELCERFPRLSRRELGWASVGLAGAAVLIVAAAPREGLQINMGTFTAWMISYSTVELNVIISLAAAALSVLALMTSPMPWRARLAAAMVCGMIAAGMLVMGWPLLLLWAAACLVKAARLRRWALAGLAAVSAAFPIITATGSPTYTIFVIMACSAITALSAQPLEERLKFAGGAPALAVIAAALILVAGLRAGVEVPVVSRLVNPILAEKEKTQQLEQIVTWMLASPYWDYRLVPCQKAYDPSSATNAVDRRHRPPTQGWHLDNYIAARRPGVPMVERPPLMVCFGGERVVDAEVIHTIEGPVNGAAIVYLP